MPSSSSSLNSPDHSSSTSSVPKRVKLQENHQGKETDGNWESGSSQDGGTSSVTSNVDNNNSNNNKDSSSSAPSSRKSALKSKKNHSEGATSTASSFGFSSVSKSSPQRGQNASATSSPSVGSSLEQHQNNGKIKFTAPLGKDPEKARRVLIEASDDALGVHRRTFVRRSTMLVKLLVFVAFAVTLAYLSQQIGSLSDLVAWLLSDASTVRAIADGKPIQAGSVVSFTDGGVQQGHGPMVGVVVTALPCDPEPTFSRFSYRVFFTNGNSTSSAIVSASATKSAVTYWMVDSSISDSNNFQLSATVDTSGENSAAAAHIALAGVGSSTLSGGSYSTSPFIVVAGAAASGSSSVYLHLIRNPSSPSSATTTSTVLASYFSLTSSTTDRSTAFAVSIVPPASASSSSSSSSSSTISEVAVVGYVCGNDLCCIDLVSWNTGAVLSGSNGPRISLPRCPTHAVHFPSTNSAKTPEISQVVLPTVPIIILTVNVTANSVSIGQILNLPITFAGTTTAMQAGNSTNSQIRVASIPPPHTKKSVLVTVALFDTFQVFQLFPSTSSASPGSVFFINTQSSSVRTRGLSGPVSLSGFVFSPTTSIASIYFREANNFQFMIQLSYINIGQASVPRMLPTIGGAEIEFLWNSDVWRHTMIVIRESPKYCGLRSVEWQGGLNFAGIASSTVQAGQAVDVIVGGIVRIFANLIPGSGYSVGVNGTLVLEDDPLALQTGSERGIVGTAFSSTEMYMMPPR